VGSYDGSQLSSAVELVPKTMLSTNVVEDWNPVPWTTGASAGSVRTIVLLNIVGPAEPDGTDQSMPVPPL
jgi:hypothetical protein